ncbi:hypothetical protein RCOM_0712080 [Ricinus communis]|uniref:RRM domain-containing protein n=1 Tax=Ricinus communis TaxID=3988 RepID=B9RRB2_RICCO|nr:hypothetical protein RCOM_0712080 [Ricinus communis]
MASSSLYSMVDFKLFYSIDRKLYTLLVMNLWRDPRESMQILALWLWLERMGYGSVVRKVLSLPKILIKDLADEMIICLSCITNDHFACENSDIPLLKSLMEKEISLKYFHNNRVGATIGVTRIINEDHAILPCTQEINGVHPQDRTVFISFSKGYPVHEWEMREFLASYFGDYIESVYMQNVGLHKQASFARIVFHSAKLVQKILGGMDKEKFTINGKHVWARIFVPKPAKTSLPSLSLVPDNFMPL